MFHSLSLSDNSKLLQGDLGADSMQLIIFQLLYYLRS
jgi:hypothetical protein